MEKTSEQYEQVQKTLAFLELLFLKLTSEPTPVPLKTIALAQEHKMPGQIFAAMKQLDIIKIVDKVHREFRFVWVDEENEPDIYQAQSVWDKTQELKHDPNAKSLNDIAVEEHIMPPKAEKTFKKKEVKSSKRIVLGQMVEPQVGKVKRKYNKSGKHSKKAEETEVHTPESIGNTVLEQKPLTAGQLLMLGELRFDNKTIIVNGVIIDNIVKITFYTKSGAPVMDIFSIFNDTKAVAQLSLIDKGLVIQHVNKYILIAVN